MSADVAIHEVPVRSEGAVRCIEAYFAELADRFPEGFDVDIHDAANPNEVGPPDGAFLVAHVEGEAMGCAGLKRHDATTAEIKRMWIDPRIRGRGVARQLLVALETTAVDLGYSKVCLDTNAVLTEAITLYRSSGYDAIERYNDNPYAAHWFAKSLRTPPTADPGP